VGDEAPQAGRRVRRWVGGVGVAGLVALALAAAAIARNVSQRVTAELRPPRTVPAAPGPVPGLTDVRLRTADGLVLRGWYVPSTTGAAVLLVHGFGGDRSQVLPEARALAARGYGVLLYDLRAHGESDGTLTTWGVTEQRDIEAGLAFLLSRPEVVPTRIGALGFSFGAMTLAEVAARDERIRSVILEGAYTSLAAMTRHDERRWGWLSGSVAEWTLRHAGIDVDRVRTTRAVCGIAPRPVLLISGDVDLSVPVPVAESLRAAACGPAALWLVHGAGHGQYAARAGAELAQRVTAFFDSTLAPAARHTPARPATASPAATPHDREPPRARSRATSRSRGAAAR
jgi:pimeloyl-ACP methyl ester carboxylesterase